MNKKIVMSLSVIGAVAAAVIGGTGAFFSDSETSTGNTFTAGAIDLKVDSQQHYNNAMCVNRVWVLEVGKDLTNPQYPVIGSECGGTWDETDLTKQKFFNFGDIKPGDQGENTISLHVLNNDAYVCATVSNLANDDNGLTEPESLVDATDGAGNGELQQHLVMTVWNDNGAGAGVKGDNIQNGSEQTLYVGAPQEGTWALYDSTTGSPLASSDTGYLGVAWSLPLATENEVQTDSMTGDISFNVVQARNNGSFKCSESTQGSAARYSSSFEPLTYSVADINGQDGWKKTGSYDSAVSSSDGTTGFGTQSLRISNGFADGAFGGQTFVPLLASGAGETSVAPNKHFEAQFDIASVLSSLQTGLAISVSPDNGSGARMSYLRFEDQLDGIHVFFDDVTDAGPPGTTAAFNESDIATITRTPHTIKFVMDFVDGPANDVVKIYIDGVLKKTGTSWEDYYRFDPEQAGGGNVLSPVDTLIFAARGSSVPANLNNGYLFDNLSLSSSL